MSRMYKVSEVADILKINRNQVYNLIHSGELKAFEIKSLRVTEEDLNEFISSRKNVYSETLGKEKKSG